MLYVVCSCSYRGSYLHLHLSYLRISYTLSYFRIYTFLCLCDTNHTLHAWVHDPHHIITKLHHIVTSLHITSHRASHRIASHPLHTHLCSEVSLLTVSAPACIYLTSLVPCSCSHCLCLPCLHHSTSLFLCLPFPPHCLHLSNISAPCLMSHRLHLV
jgi:hypothetical protein